MTKRALHLAARLHGLAALAVLAGACSSSPSSKCENVTCPPATDLCHVAGSCDSSTGTCSAQTAKTCPGGQSCDPADGQCMAAGACAGVTCPAASDLCHVAGTCSGGRCSAETAKTCSSGRSCDPADGQCKTADVCAAVTCPVASDLCHVAGTCSGGVCGAETAKTCESGMTCSVSDGQCRGADPCAGVTCPTGQSCDPGDGQCKSGSQLAPKPLAAKSLAILTSAMDLAVDSSGATYVTGSIYPPAKDFDDIRVTPSPNNGQGDVLLAKYDPGTRRAVWAKAYGDENNQMVFGLALAQDGTLAVLGNFEGTLPAPTTKRCPIRRPTPSTS